VITEPEARYIISHTTDSTNSWVVVQHFDQWYDVRKMTEREVSDLIDDLDRARSAELAAGLINPH
jgi:hypothetical protein